KSSQTGLGGTSRPVAATQSAAPTKGTSASATPSANRYFEFSDDKSSKFWEIGTSGSSVTVRYGRIGTSGQTQTKDFADESAALAHAAKLIGEKTTKGYMEK